MNQQDIVIPTERLILRCWRHEDREPFARLNAEPRVMEFFPNILTREQSDRFVDQIEARFRETGFGLYAAELRSDGRFIGFVGLNVPGFDLPFSPCVEIGWRLAPDLWGQGLATEGGRAVVRHAFAVLGLEELVSFTTAANTRSRRVMEKLGMRRNPAEDFAHPKLPESHPLRPHVLYRLRRDRWGSRDDDSEK